MTASSVCVPMTPPDVSWDLQTYQEFVFVANIFCVYYCLCCLLRMTASSMCVPSDSPSFFSRRVRRVHVSRVFFFVSNFVVCVAVRVALYKWMHRACVFQMTTPPFLRCLRILQVLFSIFFLWVIFCVLMCVLHYTHNCLQRVCVRYSPPLSFPRCQVSNNFFFLSKKTKKSLLIPDEAADCSALQRMSHIHRR